MKDKVDMQSSQASTAPLASCGRSMDQNEPLMSSTMALPRSRSNAQDPRVLIADDDSHVLDYLRRLLSLRYKVLATTNGEEALSAALGEPPDLVLSDVSMPRLDGFGLLRALRSNEATRTVPLILISGRAGQDSIVEGLESGADDYLVKPFSARELLARVGTHLQLSRMRREVRQATLENEDRLRFALETGLAGAWDLDLVDHTTHRSLEHDRIFGYDQLLPQWTYEMFLDHVLSEDRAAVDEKFRAAKASFSDWSFECRIRRVDGEFRWIWAVGRHRNDGSGKPRRMSGIIQDITERKRIEEALRQSENRYKGLHAELEQRIRERTAELERTLSALMQSEHRFSAVLEKRLKTIHQEFQEFAFLASHALSESLRKMRTFEDLLNARRVVRLDEQSRDYVSRMIRATNRMQELLDALRRYSHTETQKQEFRRIRLDEVVEDAVSDLDLQIRKIDARLEIGSLPIVNGDPYQLRQVFQNLISNAAKFHRTETKPFIKVYAEANDRSIHILVEDNGIGFDEKYLDKIFRPLQQLPGRYEHSGAGIGLAICKKIVERHGGKITARSTPGEGSTFIIELPVDQGES